MRDDGLHAMPPRLCESALLALARSAANGAVRYSRMRNAAASTSASAGAFL